MYDQPFVASQRSGRALAAGASKDVLRGPRFEKRAHGLHRPAGLELAPSMARVADAVGLMGDHCHLGGWASLLVQGNRWFDGLDRDGELRAALVHCAPGSQLRRRSLVAPFRGLLLPDETLDLGVFWAATLARAAFDEMRLAAGVTEATVVADMACSTVSEVPHTTIAAIRSVLSRHHKVRGIIQAEKALARASARSASPWETRSRLLATVGAGLPALQVNVPIFDLTGNLLGVADLLEPESGLVIESDGAHHREARAHSEDNRREERFERAGLTVSRITAQDHARMEARATVARLRAAHRDALRSAHRGWTTEQPPWWSSWSGAAKWF